MCFRFWDSVLSVGSYADIQVEQAETGCRVRQLYVLKTMGGCCPFSVGYILYSLVYTDPKQSRLCFLTYCSSVLCFWFRKREAHVEERREGGALPVPEVTVEMKKIRFLSSVCFVFSHGFFFIKIKCTWNVEISCVTFRSPKIELNWKKLYFAIWPTSYIRKLIHYF